MLARLLFGEFGQWWKIAKLNIGQIKCRLHFLLCQIVCHPHFSAYFISCSICSDWMQTSFNWTLQPFFGLIVLKIIIFICVQNFLTFNLAKLNVGQFVRAAKTPNKMSANISGFTVMLSCVTEQSSYALF